MRTVIVLGRTRPHGGALLGRHDLNAAQLTGAGRDDAGRPATPRAN